MAHRDRLDAEVGDVIVLGGHWPGDPRRTGRILRVFGRPHHERYRVRWDDGETETYVPNTDAIVQHAHRQEGPSSRVRAA